MLTNEEEAQEPKGMCIRTVNGYHVAGNEHIAIAINTKDPTDAHSFDAHTMEKDDIEMGAFDRAITWTSPGI